MSDPVIVDLNDAESKWLETNLQVASKLVLKYTGQSQPLPALPLLDATLTAWAATPEDGREDANTMVNALGLALGQHLVARLKLGWRVVTDESGTDIAVHGQPGNILVFPTNAVAKRVVKREYDCFLWLFEELCRDISCMRSAWSSAVGSVGPGGPTRG